MKAMKKFKNFGSGRRKPRVSRTSKTVQITMLLHEAQQPWEQKGPNRKARADSKQRKDRGTGRALSVVRNTTPPQPVRNKSRKATAYYLEVEVVFHQKHVRAANIGIAENASTKMRKR